MIQALKCGDVDEVEYLDDFFDYLRDYVTTALSSIASKNDYDNYPTFIQTTTAHIMSNCSDNNLTPQSIADMLGLSSKYLMRKFKENTNLSLNEYILKVRMEHAAKLLSEDTLPIREIVEKIGLDSENLSLNHFYAVLSTLVPSLKLFWVNPLLSFHLSLCLSLQYILHRWHVDYKYSPNIDSLIALNNEKLHHKIN